MAEPASLGELALNRHPSDRRGARWLSNAFEASLILLGIAAAMLAVLIR